MGSKSLKRTQNLSCSAVLINISLQHKNPIKKMLIKQSSCEIWEHVLVSIHGFFRKQSMQPHSAEFFMKNMSRMKLGQLNE